MHLQINTALFNEALVLRKSAAGHRQIVSRCKRIRNRHTDVLREYYTLITNRLNRDPRYSERCTTSYEHNLLKKIKKDSKMTVLSQCWIGNRCYDIFLPAVKFKKTCGLILEADGPIHDNEIKMKKDAHKETFVSSLGILCHCMHNADILSENTLIFIRSLLEGPRSSTKERRLMWKRIHLATILLSGTEYELRTFHELTGGIYE